MQKNPYRLLQVDPEADPVVITAAFKVLAAKLHPERDFTGIDEYRLAELKRAHALLTDPARRSAFDAESTQVAFTVGPAPQQAGPFRNRWTLGHRLAANEAEDDSAELRIDFGRYSGCTLRELVRTDPDYLRWLSRHSSGIRFRRPITRLLNDLEAEHSPVAVKPQP